MEKETKVIVARGAKPPLRVRWWVLAVIGLVVGIAVGVGPYLYQRLAAGDGISPLFLQPPFAGQRQVNILLIGTDNTGEGLADTLILARVDTERKRIAALSIPRDTRANIPGLGVRKINSAQPEGGYQLTEATVSQLLGIPINYYLQINSLGLEQLVDAAGGIEVEVEKRMHYDDHWGKLFIDLQPGLQRLNGQQAVGYVRFRHDPLGDIGRMERQQKFLRALAKQLATPVMIPHIPALVRASRKAVKTDLSIRDLTYLAALARHLDAADVALATLPAQPVDIRGISFMQLDADGVKRAVADVLYDSPCDIEVVDATGDDRGQEAIDLLQESGNRVISTRVAPEQPVTRLIDHHNRPEKARELLHLLSCHQLFRSSRPPRVQDFTIELGTDFRTSAGNLTSSAR